MAKPISCVQCRKYWERVEIPIVEPTEEEKIRRFRNPNVDFGRVCDACGAILCEMCYLRARRTCTQCGSSSLRTAFLLIPHVEGEKIIRNKLKGDAATYSVFILLVGIAGPHINAHISFGLSILIAIATALMTSWRILGSFHNVYPPTRGKFVRQGILYSVISGIGTGLIIGWGGGLFGIGVVPWTVVAMIYFYLVSVVAASAVK